MTKWTRDCIVREVLDRDLRGLSLNHVGGEHGVSPRLYQAGCRIFGSWTNAVAAAGLPPKRAKAKHEWSPARILTVIRTLARRRFPLSSREVQQRYGQFVPAARRSFGSWSKAVYAAGVDPQKLRFAKTWTKERVIECILLKVIRNESLQRTLVEPRALAEAGTRLFGSWQAALDSAGADSSQIAPFESTSNETIAAELREMSDSQLSLIQHRPGTLWCDRELLAALIQRCRSGAAMNGTRVYHEQRPLYRAAIRRFGRWKHVMALIGLATPEKQ